MTTTITRDWECPAGTFNNGRTEIGGTKFIVENACGRVILTWREANADKAEHAELSPDEWEGFFGAEESQFMGYLAGAEPGYGGSYPERLQSLLGRLRRTKEQKAIRWALQHLVDTCNEAHFYGTEFPSAVWTALDHACELLEIPHIDHASEL